MPLALRQCETEYSHPKWNRNINIPYDLAPSPPQQENFNALEFNESLSHTLAGYRDKQMEKLLLCTIKISSSLMNNEGKKARQSGKSPARKSMEVKGNYVYVSG